MSPQRISGLRASRALLLVLLLGLAAELRAQLPAEVVTVTDSATGVTPGLCQIGTQALPGGEMGVFIQVLDAPIYFTIHGPTATPSLDLGYVGDVKLMMYVDRASYFRAVRATGANARVMVTCVPR